MKNLIFLSIIFLFSFTVVGDNPVDYGHRTQTIQCDCAQPFKSTTTWTKGSRGGFYCNATSKNTNKKYKRYFSSWVKSYGNK